VSAAASPRASSALSSDGFGSLRQMMTPGTARSAWLPLALGFQRNTWSRPSAPAFMKDSSAFSFLFRRE